MNELLNILDSILGIHQKHSHGEFYWPCPFCSSHSPKLAINLTKGMWHCWKCNISGKKILSLVRKLDCSHDQINKLRDLLKDDIPYMETDTTTIPLVLPAEIIPLWIDDSPYQSKYVKYIIDRGITFGDILRYRMGYCTQGIYAGRIIIPSYDANEKLNYFVGRSIYKDTHMKYKNPPVSKNIIGFENGINWTYDKLILVEGVFDAIAVKKNAIPLLGKTMPNKLLTKIMSEKINNIYLALDKDALKQSSQIAKTLLQNGKNVFIVKLDGKDPSEIGFTKMNQLIREAQPLTFAELIKLRATA